MVLGVFCFYNGFGGIFFAWFGFHGFLSFQAFLLGVGFKGFSTSFLRCLG